MSDPRNVLQNKFQDSHRYSNFGNVLMRMHVKGFRCHTNTVIEFKSPITAFCGLNGVGKSTLLQLAASAYLGDTSQETYYINNFIDSHKFDLKPFSDNAQVEYKFLKEGNSLQQLTISHKSSGGWDGYKRRPKRKVLFVKIGSYLPRIDKSDFINRYSEEVELTSSDPVDPHVKEWTCKILSQNYDDIFCRTFSYKKRTEKINSVQQGNIIYSESHMGYGEARSQYLIRLLEGLPNKSLILIEEPEISLHPSAQHHFGCYLVDVAIRKSHQIFLTTHSEFILQALPSQSRVYLGKDFEGVKVIEGLTALEAQSLMTEGNVKALHILVEDLCAKAILSELLRLADNGFLGSVAIHASGDYNTISRTVRTLRETGLPVVAVLDADQTATPKENIFKLPGTLPPEKELFSSEAVKNHIQSTYRLNLSDFMASLGEVDHHDWFKRLANRISIDEAALVTEVARVYVKNDSAVCTSNLPQLLKEASRK